MTVVRETTEAMALAGRNIMVTRPRAQVTSFVRGLEQHGAKVLVFPTVEIRPLHDTSALDDAVLRLDHYGWLVFTSANGVRYFLERCGIKGQMDSLARVKLAAIGPQTAQALENNHLRVDLVPREYRAEGILEALGPEQVRGVRFLLARVAGARDILPETLRRWGGFVDVVETYRSVPVEEGGTRLLSLFKTGKVHCVTFTSSSTVRAFVDLLGGADMRGVSPETTVACIGPITTKTARDLGLEVQVEAREYTVDGLIRAVVEYYRADTSISKQPG